MKYLLFNVIIFLFFEDYKCAGVTAKMKKLLSKSITDKKGTLLDSRKIISRNILKVKRILHIPGGVTVLTYGTKSNTKQLETFHAYLGHFGLPSKVSNNFHFSIVILRENRLLMFFFPFLRNSINVAMV